MNRVFLATLCKVKLSCRPTIPISLSRYNFGGKNVYNQFYSSSASSTVEENERSVLENNDEERCEPNNVSTGTVSTRDSIKDRLLRLSMQSPEEFVPSDSLEVAEKKRWDRYSKCFPDQKLRSNNNQQRFNEFRSDGFSNPNRGSSFRNPNQRQPYRQSGYNGEDNYDSGRNYRQNKYENQDFDDFPQQSYNRRYNGKFDGEYMTPSSRRDQFSNQRSGRSVHRGIANEADDEDISTRMDYKQMQRDYDLDDEGLAEEPRQSSPIRFSNQENQAAIKDAYVRRLKMNESGSKREFHTCVALNNLQRIKSEDGLASGSFIKGKSDWSSHPQKSSFSKPNPLKNSDAQLDNDSRFAMQDSLLADDDNPEVFGTLSKSKSKSMPSVRGNEFSVEISSPENIYSVEEEDDVVFRPEVRMSMRKLEKQTKELLQQKKLTDALDLFTTTIKEGGFRYTLKELAYVYRIMIAECAKAGYVQVAHKLYVRMVKRGLYVLPGVYTSLFNACGNSPWLAEQNIELMDRLREQMARKGYLPNDVNYNAMIKGYGRCGSIEKAFAVVDEMLERKDKAVLPNADTFNFLLQACITDKTNGFRNALFTWNKMKAMKIRPKFHAYHLLLKSARECGVSIPEDIEKQIQKKNKKLQTVQALLVESNETELLSQTKSTFDPDIEKAKYLLLGSLTEDNLSRIKTTLEIISCRSTLDVEIFPKTKFNYHAVAELSDAELEVIERLRYPHYRLLMLGGLRGILQQMRSDMVKPDIKIVQELVMLVRPVEALDVMQLLHNYKIKPDIQLYNVLIKKLSMSNHPENARSVLQLINNHRLNPDIYTWSALALGCRTWDSAKQLLADMEISKVTPNIVMIGSLLSQACRNCDPHFVVMIMNEITRRELPTSPKMLEIIENFRKNMKKAVLQAEKKEPITVPGMASVLKFNQEQFLKDFRMFKLQYGTWIRGVGVEIDPVDPWAEDFASRFRRRDFSQKQKTPEESNFSKLNQSKT